MTILHINSSIRAEQAYSSRLAGKLIDRLRAGGRSRTVIFKDLAKTPHPLLDDAALQALRAPVEQRTAEQQARVAVDDGAIDEVRQADRIVLAVPMYNFGIPAQLKAWLDAITRAGVTFRYTENGPEGLLAGKKVYVILTFGGIHCGTGQDLLTPYLRTLLGFLGMTDVTFIYAEGLAMGEDSVERALTNAESDIAALAVD